MLVTSSWHRPLAFVGKRLAATALICISSALHPTTTTAQPCPGDCSEDGFVTVDEILVGIAIGLGTAVVSDCTSLDVDGNGFITVEEIVRSVLRALEGCPVDPTPTPTATPSPSPTSPPFTPDAFPVFTDVTERAGVRYRQHTPQEPPNCILDVFTTLPNYELIACWPERFSGGVAVGDYDSDGWPDLYVTRLQAPDILFRNRGDGTFVNVSAAAGIDFDAHTNGAVWGDIDNDGDLDLYVTTIGYDRYILLINDGGGRFRREGTLRNAALDTRIQHIGTGATFADYDRDGWLDLYISEWRWIDFVEDDDAPSHARLLRNRGAQAPGFFDDVTAAAGVAQSTQETIALTGTFGFTPTFADLDNDGWPDLTIAADFRTSKLFWNAGDSTFVDGTVAAGVGTDENGMGSAIGDYDNDGDLDWFVSSVSCGDSPGDAAQCSGNRLYRNEGGRVFSDQTDSAGVRDGGWGWGSAFFDADNDGDLDLVQVAGMNFPVVVFDDEFNDDPTRLWVNDGGGRMREMAGAAGLSNRGGGRGLAVFDYDRDGDLDLFIVNNGTFPRLYRNSGRYGNHWLKLRLIGTRSNRGAVGARVALIGDGGLPTQMRVVDGGAEFQGQSETTVHFGLGPVRRAAMVEIRWPSGMTQTLRDLQPNRELVVVEPAP